MAEVFLPSQEYSQGSIVSGSANDYTNSAQVDFRVEAILGHYVPDSPDHMFPQYWFETDVSSGWSKVQTITISSGTFPPVNSEGNSQLQSPEQTQPSNVIFTNPLFLLSVSILLGSIVVAVVIVILRKHLKTPIYSNTST